MKGHLRIRDLSEIQCRIRDNALDRYPGSGIRRNLDTGYGLGKKTILRVEATEVRDAGSGPALFPTLSSGRSESMDSA